MAQIAATANINRTTLYRHFNNQSEIAHEIMLIGRDKYKEIDIYFPNIDELKTVLELHLNNYKKNHDLLMVFGKIHTNVVFSKVSAKLKAAIEQYFANIGVDQTTREYAFYIDALLESLKIVTQDWIEAGCKDTVEYVSGVLLVLFKQFEKLIISR